MKTLKIIKYLIAVPNIHFAKVLYKNNVPLRDVKYNIINNSLYFNKYKIRADAHRFNYLIDGLNFIIKLEKYCKAVVSERENKLYIEIFDLRFQINTWEELNILNEVFVIGIYNMISTGNYIVFDIGMNVGITSLYLALRKNINKIYAFEPFKSTYEQGLLNLSLNPSVAEKIHTFNFGLGSSERIEEIEFLPEMKGSMGINGIPNIMINRNNVKTVCKKKMEIKDAGNIINSLISRHVDERFIAKIDCEGAEYEVLDSFSKLDILSKLDIVIIEWHIKGSESLIKHLIEAKFSVFSFNDPDNNIGMIYAKRMI